MSYPWSINITKLDRAIKKSVSKDEADILRIYESLGGKIDRSKINLPVSEVPRVLGEPKRKKKNA